MIGRHIFDLYSTMPYHGMDEHDRKMYWDDNVHFTEAGYQAIGKAVAERLINIIESEEGKGAKAQEGKKGSS